jgi:glucan-binding YG repeat protein
VVNADTLPVRYNNDRKYIKLKATVENKTFESTTSMITKNHKVNGKWYYLYSDGSMASNIVIYGYRLDENGAWI